MLNSLDQTMLHSIDMLSDGSRGGPDMSTGDTYQCQQKLKLTFCAEIYNSQSVQLNIKCRSEYYFYPEQEQGWCAGGEVDVIQITVTDYSACAMIDVTTVHPVSFTSLEKVYF